MTTPEMEIALSKYFNPRRNLIVPNISWGLFNHECDLLVVTPVGYAYEIEIKISKADLIKDGKKWHKHDDKMISKLFFAVPEKMLKYIEYIPAEAGIISVGEGGYCHLVREAKRKNKYLFSNEKQFQVARLATLRIWGLKATIERYKREKKKP